MAGFFKFTDRQFFSDKLIGQLHRVYFTREAQEQHGRPNVAVAYYMGQRLIMLRPQDEQQRKEQTLVYLQCENGQTMEVQLSEIQTIWPPRNDKRDAERAKPEGAGVTATLAGITLPPRTRRGSVPIAPESGIRVILGAPLPSNTEPEEE